MKPYLVFMAGPNSLIDVQEMVEPIKNYIRGINCLLHDLDKFSEEAKYILKVNNELGAGNVIFGTYVGRHDYSRNRILFESGMKNGDWYIQTDVLEHPKSDFLSYVPTLIEQYGDEITCFYYYGKPFLVKFSEYLEYRGNPHEGLHGVSGQKIELANYFPDETQVRQNMRPFKRGNDPKHFVNHYLKYYLFPNSNQCLLGLDGKPNRDAVWEIRQAIRDTFLDYLRRFNISRDTNAILEYWRNKELNDDMKYLISREKILSDAYRWNILKDDKVIDNHDLSDIIKFL